MWHDTLCLGRKNVHVHVLMQCNVQCHRVNTQHLAQLLFSDLLSWSRRSRAWTTSWTSCPAGASSGSCRWCMTPATFPPRASPALRRIGIRWGHHIVVCSDKRSKNPTSIIMQYVKHSNWRLKYSVKWRTEILKVTIHHFTITLSLSSMWENPSEFQSRIPVSKRCSYPTPSGPLTPPGTPGLAQTGITPRPAQSNSEWAMWAIHNSWLTSLSCPLTITSAAMQISLKRHVYTLAREGGRGKKFNSSISISNKIKLELQVENFSDAWYFLKKFEAHFNLSFQIDIYKKS